MQVLHGSCLCGGVKFEISGPLSHLLNCHCSKCRKQHGAAFRSRARVRVEDFRWLQGEELVSYYESSPGFHRGFCSRCGSPIVNRPAPNYARAAIRGTDLACRLGGRGVVGQVRGRGPGEQVLVRHACHLAG